MMNEMKEASTIESGSKISSQAKRNRRFLSLHVAALTVVCGMPLIGLTLYFLSTGLHREIAIAERERAGLGHVRHAVGVFQKAVRLAWSENGDDVEMMQGLEEALVAMDQMEVSVSGNIQTAPILLPPGGSSPKANRGELWQGVKDADADSGERVKALHKLTENLHQSIFEVSDQSGLSSGPENEISALTDVVAVCLPMHVERLMHMHESLAPRLKVNGWDDSSREVAAIFVRQLEDEDIKRLSRSVEAALSADLRSAHQLDSFQADYPQHAKMLLTSLQELSRALRPFETEKTATNETPREFDEVLDAAFESAVTGWNASIDQLDDLVADQISEAVSRRNHALAIAGIIMAGLVPLAWSYFRFFIRPLMQSMIDEAASHQRDAEEARKEADESTRRLRQTQAALYGHSAVISIDLEHRIIMANDRSCELTGYSREELEQQFFVPSQTPLGDDSDFAASLWRQVESGGVWNGNLCHSIRTGGHAWVNATIFPFLDQQGKPVEFVVIETDITELMQARREAEEAVLAKSRFLAMMSHEIRTPLNGVVAFAQLMADTPLDEQQRDYARTILTSGESLLLIINDILDFSKLEAGKTELEIRPVALRFLIEDVLELLAPQARAKNIELVYWLDPAVPEGVLADGSRLRQVLLNLAGNAVKFTAQGHVEISILPTSEGALEFHVRDTGIGIPLERQDRLFKAFSQVEVSDTRNYGGTGLGLTISQLLVSLMGGRISVTSAAGEGSDFHFTLPSEVADVKKEIEERSSKNHEQLVNELRGKRILVVDDLPANHRLMGQILSKYEAEMTEASSAVEAMEILEKESFDLAILDYLMPEEDGISLAKRIRGNIHYVGMPLIMVAAVQPDPSSIPEGLFSAVILRPIRNQPFATSIATSLARNESMEKEPSVQGSNSQLSHFAQNHPLRIAVVDDNMVNLKVMKVMLRTLGYEATLFQEIMAALEKMRDEKFDLIMMDVQMPLMNGHDATRYLREGKAGDLNQHTMVVALTAGTMSEERAACLEAGMNDFVSKPILRADLLEKLTEVSARITRPA